MRGKRRTAGREVVVECYEQLFHVDSDRGEAERVVGQVASSLMEAVDLNRAMGRPGQAYWVSDEWVVAVGDRRAAEKQGLTLRSDYYAVAYPITSELAAYVLKTLSGRDDVLRVPWDETG